MAYQPCLQEFQNVLPDTLLVLGVDGTILDNHVPESADLFTLTEPLNGLHYSAALPASIAASLAQSIELARNHPAPVAFEVDTVCHGKDRVYEVRLVNREDDACLAIFRDITLRQRVEDMEQQIARLRFELAQAERFALVGRMTAAIMHDVGQPITAINANASVAAQLLASASPDTRELQQINAEIVVCAERATGTFEKLRDSLGCRKVNTELVDINQLVEEVALMARKDLMMRDILLQTNFSARLPCINGGRVELQQVVLNLLLNAADAVDAMEKPAIVVTTSQVESNVAIDVSDNGTGIAARVMPRLFEPFFSTKPQGMGMGLAISSDVVYRHGGTIQAFNNAGSGAVFRVLLPTSQPNAKGQLPGQALPGVSSNDPDAYPGGQGGPAREVSEAIHRSRRARAHAIGVNMQATINYLRLARILREPEACRRSVRNALMTLHSSDQMVQKLGIPAIELREISLMRVQILELMAELE